MVSKGHYFFYWGAPFSSIWRAWCNPIGAERNWQESLVKDEASRLRRSASLPEHYSPTTCVLTCLSTCAILMPSLISKLGSVQTDNVRGFKDIRAGSVPRLRNPKGALVKIPVPTSARNCAILYESHTTSLPRNFGPAVGMNRSHALPTTRFPSARVEAVLTSSHCWRNRSCPWQQRRFC